MIDDGCDARCEEEDDLASETLAIGGGEGDLVGAIEKNGKIIGPALWGPGWRVTKVGWD